ncbi:hypothetical protein SAMN05421543_11883, partial [Alicyclobacillus macrosporangiidus]
FRHDDPSMIGFWGNHLADQGLALGVDYLTLTLSFPECVRRAGRS